MFYKETTKTEIQETTNILYDDGIQIWSISPLDRFWPLYLEWIEEGNEPQAWEEKNGN